MGMMSGGAENAIQPSSISTIRRMWAVKKLMRSIADTAEERWIGTQMIDRERVIKGLQCCVRSDSEAECPTECPYYRKCWEDDYPDGKLALSLHKDTLELLREQPAKDTNVLGKWISVKNRMPAETHSMFFKLYGTPKWRDAMWKEESDNVLVAISFEDGSQFVTSGYTQDGKWHTGISKILPYTVTHWMQLPEPPEEVKQAK